VGLGHERTPKARASRACKAENTLQRRTSKALRRRATYWDFAFGFELGLQASALACECSGCHADGTKHWIAHKRTTPIESRHGLQRTDIAQDLASMRKPMNDNERFTKAQASTALTDAQTRLDFMGRAVGLTFEMRGMTRLAGACPLD